MDLVQLDQIAQTSIWYHEFISDSNVKSNWEKVGILYRKTLDPYYVILCSYSFFTADPLSYYYHVDHYRPIGKKLKRFCDCKESPDLNLIKECIGDAVIPEFTGNRHGYWWLKFNENNLFMAGPVINGNKLNIFPLRHDSIKATERHRDHLLERPFILHPDHINNNSFVVWNDGNIYPKSQSLTYKSSSATSVEQFIEDNWNYITQLSTIDILKLNDKILVSERKLFFFLVTCLCEKKMKDELVDIIRKRRHRLVVYYALLAQVHAGSVFAKEMLTMF